MLLINMKRDFYQEVYTIFVGFNEKYLWLFKMVYTSK